MVFLLHWITELRVAGIIEERDTHIQSVYDGGQTSNSLQAQQLTPSCTETVETQHFLS